VPSLRQLLDRHSTLLVIDACSPRVEASLWRDGTVNTAAVEDEASAALPVAVARVLAEAGEKAPGRPALRIRDLDAVALCDGPGSVLGIRLAAASLRVWGVVRPKLTAYSFHSLPLLAASHPGLTIIADARRDTWHAVRPDAPRDLLRLPSSELAAVAPGTLATPDNFRRWSALPAGVEPRALPYSAAALLAAAPDEPFFNDSPEPDAFMHEAPSYVSWTPRVHQAPGAGDATNKAAPAGSSAK
jgi:tRNA threonylcarbamoyladenosine biosynthesis protein TsaB